MDEEIGEVLDCVPILYGRDRFVTPLRGGITNRNYLVDTGDESFVLRIGGENTELLGIDRAVEYACSLAAARLHVGTEVIAFLPEHNALVTRFVPGRLLRPADVQEPATLGRIVDALRRYHNGPPGAGLFSPFAVVREYYALAWNRQVAVPPSIGEAMERLARIEAALETADPPCPCHNDLLPANLIDDGSAVRIIDWEYGGMGDRFFDLGNLAVNNELDEAQECTLLELYFGELQPAHLRRLRLMRLASDMRESLWGFLQAGISTLDYGFLDYGRLHLERFLRASEALDIGPRSVSIQT
ncbi:MAG TPA: phosphotransferase [Chloroflexota bacterium]